MSTCSTHVLDATLGRPAAGLAVVLATGAGDRLAQAHTDEDGRVRFDVDLAAGDHRLTFATAAWFTAQERSSFHPEVSVAFTVDGAEPGAGPGSRHYHVALLLGPYSYTTYRGS